jgi:hypothetical protein
MARTIPEKSYDIVLRTPTGEAPVPLESVSDADEATLAFHMQFERLTLEGTTGELVLLNRHGQNPRLDQSPVLRLPLD